MRNFFQSNNFYKVVSLILAFTLWLYVNERQSPMAENVFYVPLEIRGLASNLMVSEKPDTVQVRLRGRHSVVENIKVGDLQAYVHLGEAHAGTNTVPVTINFPEVVELVEAKPKQAHIVVDHVSEIQLPLQVQVKGNPASGFSALEPTVNPTRVSVAGPQRVLDSLETAYVNVDLSQKESNYIEWLPVEVKSKKGEEAGQWVRIKPSTAKVFIPIVSEEPVQDISITAPLEGNPAAGYRVVRVIVEPSTASVNGPADLLSNYKYFQTEPVNISGLKANVTVEKKLILPPGVTWVKESPVLVTVVIQTEKQ